jgi:hypothetical protein
VSIAAWAWDGAIGRDDYHAVGGGESAHIAFDPDNPDLIYATTINGTLTEFNERSQKKRYIVPYPERVYGEDRKTSSTAATGTAGDHLAPRSLGDLLRHPVPAEEYRPRHDLGSPSART